MLLSQLNAAASPLTHEQLQKLQGLVGELNPIQQAWVSGYLAATANSAALSGIAGQATAGADESAPLTILFGSQTGNAKGVANQIKAQAEARGLTTKLVNMADYKPANLKKEKFLVIAVSTYGEGEPPEDAEALHEFLAGKKAPKLEGVKQAVIGLGDSSYEFFCQTAKDFEARLAALGAEIVVPRADLDVDYEAEAEAWIAQALDALEPALKAQQQAGGGNVISMPFGVPQAAVSQYTKQNPFAAELSVVQKITGRNSSKDVRHIEISLEGSDITYQPGDSLGVYFLNDPQEVAAVIDALKLDKAQTVKIGELTVSLETALIEHLELTQSYPGFVEKYAIATGNEELSALANDKAALRAYIEERQIFDVIKQNPANIEAQALVDCCRKLQARLYSIASSQAEVEEEVHLTVGLVEFDTFGEKHFGGCSGYLANRAEEGTKVKVFSEHNDNFRLPVDNATPVIMVGPGTGIAPFRAFLQEREARDAEGENWLFFGNPHFTEDFLYQVEIQKYVKSGLLTHVDLAFSRDQAEKIYVQDRLREKGEAVFAWLEKGAHFYVCGDASRMAKDVHQALIDIIKTHGGKDDEQAEQYLKALRSANRYQKDVY
ncbi:MULTISPECIES: assimilatory sulfite reductase (NADPH) flavoprotein subunit [Pseudoalteromonas]|uniref:assimilatory sulfite reductase (NADPH) flavoprotein subunit n=1 Tax=Pseudoalteromonas TaxID=53246 RepID=UPI0015726593|nr:MULTISPECIES: assimilatory sulfite reductase (NADPH) flavoprotein subunit [Pseudoalteromonas]MBR8842951.1 assimilatory sulfite reductase (NADPH) flavoprotein subunit [Pseudoalteromonas sp. JC3]NSY36106.1 assimilatory sulfite reductase (NADPH) flavoprotein subunit [Pseudoalteromonas sp. JC28]QUI72702.1 assimilatory sulfite reductase (NADPH) flavoprotein subunit [Pseudoalteromonas sp. M8]UDM63348.1 assimilatory sulfite reductase (NADPH) flavoprotein subunit [Pseudoalteromonas piscicida]WJE105